MEKSITVILFEERGFDRAFQLMYMPNPIWTENEKPLQEDNTHIGFDMKGRFAEILAHCDRSNHVVDKEKECVILLRKENYKFMTEDVNMLLKDIEDCSFKYTLLTY